MKSILPANQVALLGTVIMPREFMELTVRDRTTGAPVIERLWSDRGDVSADMLDPDTGGVLSASWSGSYGLVTIDNIPRVANLVVQRIEIRMLAIGVDTDRILRLYDPHQGKVRIWRGFLNTETRRMVGPAESRFVGFIDDVALPMGKDGEEAYATLTCTSHTQEASRYNPEKRSDASQRRRSATDNFFESAASVGDAVYFWGQNKGAVPTVPPPASQVNLSGSRRDGNPNH